MRPPVPEPLAKYPAPQVVKQLSLWRYLEFAHSVHVEASEHRLQSVSHALPHLSVHVVMARMECMSVEHKHAAIYGNSPWGPKFINEPSKNLVRALL